ncbi:MAG TPA: putative lipid II flippase FtsW [Actinomycetota bacterium]|nr:putative lipid II flippase FtsW [Actinomycetota bacterium]
MAERRAGEARASARRAEPGPRRPILRLVDGRTERAARARDRARLARIDLRLLVASAGFLTAVGLVMVLSAGSVSAAQGYGGNSFWYFQRQVAYAAIGIGIAYVISRIPTARWRVLALPLLGISAVLMLIASRPTSGTSLYGASRWIDLGPVTLQPSEFAKLGLVAFAAAVLARKSGKLDDPGHLLLPLGPVVAGVALLGLLQRDLGTTLILCGTVVLMLFVAGARLRHLLVGGGLGLLVAAYLIFGETYRRTRFFDAWLDPWADPKRSGYQLIQGLIAIGSGGWLGTGLGTSRAKWDFLPNAHSDFIFAVIGEELGLLGCLVVLVGFGVLLWAGIRIAIHAPGTFERLLAAGIVSWIGLQTVINLGAVTGLLPITGVPLPLVSFGGSALVVTLAGIGVLAGIAKTSGPRPRPAPARGGGR